MIVDSQILEVWTKPDNSENHPSNDQTFQTLSGIFQRKMESIRFWKICLRQFIHSDFVGSLTKTVFLLSQISQITNESEWEVMNEN